MLGCSTGITLRTVILPRYRLASVSADKRVAISRVSLTFRRELSATAIGPRSSRRKSLYAAKIASGQCSSSTTTAAWQSPVAAPDGAPNVIVILLDDVGFGQTSTFGGLIPTPNFDKLASEGLKFNRFHTTAICGPSRAALLTGRNHHECGNGFLMEWATGFPSYSTMLPRSTATIGEILKGNGYTTWWYGKNHNTPDWETTVAGPFDRWPTGMGFDYFYGFNAGETHQYYPVVFENTTPVEPNKTPAEGYHFMTDMTDRAIARMKFSKSVAPNKPFFMHRLRRFPPAISFCEFVKRPTQGGCCE